jgi:ubiquinone biosynthesis protein
MMRSLSNSCHLVRILWVLARHDVFFFLREQGAISFVARVLTRCVGRRSKKPRGVRIADALTELGPTFIKLGQALSTRADILGDEIASDLSHLQDRLPPFEGAKAVRIIEASLGQPLEALFSSFYMEAIAAASVAQVHFATTTEGREVAVKVLRPDVAKRFAKDIRLLYWLAGLVERWLPSAGRLKPREVVRTLEETIRFELDARYEAAAAVEFRQQTHPEEGFYIPDIDWQRTSDCVMTMERIHGISIADTAALVAAGHDLDDVIETLATSFFNQVFRDGFFHGDLHPGNLFVLLTGRIAAVDFGITGRLDYQTRIWLALIFKGFLDEDYVQVAQSHIDAGYVPATTSVAHFALACRAIAQPILRRPLNEVSGAKLLAQLFKVTETFQMETQPQLLLLQKNLMTLEGIGRQLNPQVNLWQMVEAPVKAWAQDNLSVSAQASRHFKAGLVRLQHIPAMLDRLDSATRALADGQLSLHDDTLHRLGGQGRTPIVLWVIAGLLALIAFSTP